MAVTAAILALLVAPAWDALAEDGAGIATDSSMRRTCLSLVAVLNPAGAEFDIDATQPLGFDGGVIITYRAQPSGGRARTRKLGCVFGPVEQASGGRRQLLAVTSDGRSLGPARFRLLKRFWLPSAEAEAAATALSSSHAH